MPQLSVAPDGFGGLLVMSYPGDGLTQVVVKSWPLLGWTMDEMNPINSKPITIGDPLSTAPPATGAIKSPAWAYCISEEAVFLPDDWRGSLGEFFMFLATNNGAYRTIKADLTHARLLNYWQTWARENQTYIGYATQPILP